MCRNPGNLSGTQYRWYQWMNSSARFIWTKGFDSYLGYTVTQLDICWEKPTGTFYEHVSVTLIWITNTYLIGMFILIPTHHIFCWFSPAMNMWLILLRFLRSDPGSLAQWLMATASADRSVAHPKSAKRCWGSVPGLVNVDKKLGLSWYKTV